MISLSDLETRLEQAPGPSRNLDLRMELLFRPNGIYWGRGDDLGCTPYALALEWDDLRLIEVAETLSGQHPCYTASIDACIKLLDYILPEWFWRGGHVPSGHWLGRRAVHGWTHLSRTIADHCDRNDEATGWAETPALAFCLAIVRGAKTRALFQQPGISSTGSEERK